MKQIFKFICCGSVDDGKSTLLGRILLNTGNVKKDQMEDAIKTSAAISSETVELAMLLDGLLAEREQQITIDIAHRYFDYQNIRFHIYDCPGHEQYTKNMAIAAAEADSAIVVIDVTKGIQKQTEKHLEICSLFNIKNIIICLTKCDLIMKQNKPDYKLIKKQSEKIESFIKKYNFNYNIIPVSALTDYNISKVLNQLCKNAKDFYEDEQQAQTSIMHILTSKSFKNKRYYYGREVRNSKFKKGNKYNVLPQNTVITIKNIPQHGCFQTEENVDISSGDCITNHPMIISDEIKHQTIWFDTPAKKMLFKHGARIARIVKYTDNVLKLDAPLIFNNIDDVKPNGFGIIFDHNTKKTLGCCVFTGNNNREYKNIKEIYFLVSNGKITAKTIERHIKLLNISPVILDLEKITHTAKDIERDNIFEITLLYAQQLTEQGFDVLLTTKTEYADVITKTNIFDTVKQNKNNMLLKMKNHKIL